MVIHPSKSLSKNATKIAQKQVLFSHRCAHCGKAGVYKELFDYEYILIQG